MKVKTKAKLFNFVFDVFSKRRTRGRPKKTYYQKIKPKLKNLFIYFFIFVVVGLVFGLFPITYATIVSLESKKYNGIADGLMIALITSLLVIAYKFSIIGPIEYDDKKRKIPEKELVVSMIVYGILFFIDGILFFIDGIY